MFACLPRQAEKRAQMTEAITISVDAMGGDHAPRAVIHGAHLAFKERKNTRFIFHGIKEQIDPLLDEFPALKPVSVVRSCTTTQPSEYP